MMRLSSILFVTALFIAASNANAQELPEQPPASPAPAEDPIAAAIARAYGQELRAQGIAELEVIVGRFSEHVEARHALARALSWERRFDESLRHYEVLLERVGPNRVSIELERSQVLSWKGDLAATERGYSAILAQNHQNADALLGLAQIRRWAGRAKDALSPIEQAAKIAPNRADIQEELRLIKADLVSAPKNDRKPPQPAPNEKPRIAFFTSTPVSDDTTNTLRVASRSSIEFEPIRSLRVAVGGGFTFAKQGETEVDYRLGGADVAWSRGLWTIDAGGAFYYAKTDGWLGDARLSASLRGQYGSLTVSARRRPFLETAPAIKTGVEAFHSAGVGGALVLEEVRRSSVNELRTTGSITPARWVYVYADARGLSITDSNIGYTAAAGLGIDPLAIATKLPVGVWARWDSYLTGFRETRTGYFSPNAFDRHTVSGELRWSITPGLQIAGNVGYSFAIGAAAGGGLSGGGWVDWRLGPFVASLRVQIQDELYFQSRRGWLRLGWDFF